MKLRTLDDLKLFIKAVRLVTMDTGFELQTENAQKARLTADRLLKFIDANKNTTEELVRQLLRLVRACCSHPRAVTCHTFKERLWEKYYKLCSKEDFRTMWKSFIQTSVGFDGSPIFSNLLLEQFLNSSL